MHEPETRYAKASNGAHIAYQVVGQGSVDFVHVTHPWVSDLEYAWEFELTADLYSWLGHGVGLSSSIDAEPACRIR